MSRRSFLGAAVIAGFMTGRKRSAANQSPTVVLERGNPERTGEVPHAGPSEMPRERWRVALGASVGASPTVVGDVIYTGDLQGTLWALNAHDGQPRWSYSTGGVGIWGAAAYADDIIYVGSSNGSMFAIDANSGENRWSFETDDAIESSPLLLGDAIIFSSWDGRIYSLDANSGEQWWNRELGSMIAASPAYLDGVVYVPTDSDGVFALDASTGDVKWHFDDRQVLTAPTAAIAHELMFVASKAEGDIIALRLADGSLVWHSHLDRSVGASPAVSGGALFASSEGFDEKNASYTKAIHSLDALTGTEVWRFEPDDIVWSAPVVAGGCLYFSDLSGGIYGLATIDGALLWKISGSGSNGSQISVADGMLYIGVENGLLALG